MNLFLWLLIFATINLQLYTSVFISATTITTTTTTTTTATSMVWLRIIQINDVYELDNFPRLKTLIRSKMGAQEQQTQSEQQQLQLQQRAQRDENDELATLGSDFGECVNENPSTGSSSISSKVSVGPDRTIIICAGDFVAPSLLSSLDKGTSMVDILNRCGVTHVCFGNHEADIPVYHLQQHILHNSNFVWINSNAQQINERLCLGTPEYAIVDVISKVDPTKTKRVALLGLLTNDKSLYRPGAFANANIEDVIPTTRKLLDKLQHPSTNNNNIDLIIPITHQRIEEDREFCQTFTGKNFPIVCGGHDHEVFQEIHNGSRIIKAGMDAVNAAVIDIRWEDDTSNSNAMKAKPSIQVEIVPTQNYEADTELLQLIDGHKTIVRELECARLFQITEWMNGQEDSVFSTYNNRLGPSTGTQALCTMLGMGLRAQCCILNAGAVRANKVYDDKANPYFTWSDLKSEIPFSTGMTACYVPGKVLEATITHSRHKSRQTPPLSSGGYLHTSRNIKYCDKEEQILSIGGKAFDPEIRYLTALPAQFFSGIDNHVPLLEWAAQVSNQEAFSEESAIPAKMVLVEVFSSLLWLQLGAFDEIDCDRDGVLTFTELKERMMKVYGNACIADMVVQNIFAVADITGSGSITPLEMMCVQYAAKDLMDHVSTNKEIEIMKEVAASVLGKDPAHDHVHCMVQRMRETLDVQGDGMIHRTEIMEVLGELKVKEFFQ